MFRMKKHQGSDLEAKIVRWCPSNIYLVEVLNRYDIRHVVVICYNFVRTELVMVSAGHVIEDEVVDGIDVVVGCSEDGTVVVGSVVNF